MMTPHAAASWASLQAIRREAPLIHNITNFVSMDVAANILLALGASPAMVHAEEEAVDFVRIARALVVNIGTLAPAWVRAMDAAARAAGAVGKPWVLDPVGVGATPYRTEAASRLAGLRPTVIRANASEVLALAGAAQGPTKGVDSSHASGEAADAAVALAAQTGSVVAVTGAIDLVTDGRRRLEVRNGHPLMTKVTALGCAVSAVIGAFLVVESDPVLAAAQGLAVFGLAAELAAAEAAGPGSLRWRLLDRLAGIDEAALARGIRIA
jgi:hydroxyethylthiazole kinase